MITSALLALSLAVSSGGTPAPPPQPITVTGQRDKPVCRTERSTGSVIPKRICLTAAQQQQQTERSLQVKAQIIERIEKEREILELKRALP